MKINEERQSDMELYYQFTSRSLLFHTSHKTQQLSPRLKLRPPLGVIHKRTVVSSTFTPNFKRLRVEISWRLLNAAVPRVALAVVSRDFCFIRG